MSRSAAARQTARAITQASQATDASAWVNALADVPLFAALGKRHLRKVAGISRIVRFENETSIVRSGEPGDAFYVLVDGVVRVSRRGLPSLTLGQGSFFGEIALLDGGPRAATVTANGPVTCLVVGRARFLKLLRSEPALAVAMVEELARRLRATQASV